MKHTFPSVNEQMDRIQACVTPTEIISEEELVQKLEKSLKTGTPLIIKQGFDASAPDLHLGHAISIWKLQAFQELGHTVVFVIGDFTAMVGDPSGKSKTRPRLSREAVEKNAETYKDQVTRILDPNKIQIRFNSEWHAQRNIYEFLNLTAHYTVRRMLERDDFWKRFSTEQPISILEFLYPLFQAYDSVELKADVELGGTDQRFNLMLARHIQRAYDQEPEVAIFMPLLRGTDGSEKMSKSLGNTIGITDEPNDMYGKLMSISDDLLWDYVLASGCYNDEALAVKLQRFDQLGLKNETVKSEFKLPPQCKLPTLADDVVSKVKEGPYEHKHDLARHLVARYHRDEQIAEEAYQNFMSRFRDKELPTPEELLADGKAVMVEAESEWLPRLIVLAEAAKSNGEANRLIKSGAVSIDGEKLMKGASLDMKVEKPFVVKVGKLRVFLVYRDGQV